MNLEKCDEKKIARNVLNKSENNSSIDYFFI